ncbi:hypothetical protein Tco_1163189 [Tanacetum coccineum]
MGRIPYASKAIYDPLLGQIPLHSQGVGDSIFEDNVGESSQSSHRRVEDENVGESSKTSDDSADDIELIRDAFPHLTSLPSSVSEAKKLTKDLGLGYEKIDACPNDCMIYWDTQKDQTSCLVRLGLASDGVNPFRTMSTTHSTWPVLLIPYNLPPWLCMKQQSFILSSVIPGEKAPGNDIDVYLQPLIHELKLLWKEFIGFSFDENFVEEETAQHHLWKKKSIFFDLEYWKFNLLRHNLDVMHIEKNVCDNLLGTLLNLDGKTKDNENSRKDLMEMGIRHDLHLINRPNKKPYMPPACYTMSSVEKSNFLQVLKSLKVPDGYSSNISRGVSMKDRKLINLKSHDGHILMQDILSIALRVSMLSRAQSRVVKVVSDICLFFKRLCAKVLDPDELDKMESEIALTLCG